jgi:hypothetical protein
MIDMKNRKNLLPLSPQPARRYCVALSIAFVILAGNSSPGQVTSYTGMCHASAAVALDSVRFVVGDDEENILRVFCRDAPGEPEQSFGLRDLFPGVVEDGEDLETDIEGAAALGGTIFWIGSHGTSRKGKPRPARHRLFAVSFTQQGNGRYSAAAYGRIYTTLIEDLSADPRYAVWKLRMAESIRSKSIGGLNIEGLAATPAGALLIGFRNPLNPGSSAALIATLLNPMEVIAGKRARFGDPVTINLGGLGIRSMEWRKGEQYLIVAGAAAEHTDGKTRMVPARLRLWQRDANKTTPVAASLPADFTPEAAFFFPRGDTRTLYLLSDDGRPACKNSFRSATVILP